MKFLLFFFWIDWNYISNWNLYIFVLLLLLLLWKKMMITIWLLVIKQNQPLMVCDAFQNLQFSDFVLLFFIFFSLSIKMNDIHIHLIYLWFVFFIIFLQFQFFIVEWNVFFLLFGIRTLTISWHFFSGFLSPIS